MDIENTNEVYNEQLFEVAKNGVEFMDKNSEQEVVKHIVTAHALALGVFCAIGSDSDADEQSRIETTSELVIQLCQLLSPNHIFMLGVLHHAISSVGVGLLLNKDLLRCKNPDHEHYAGDKVDMPTNLAEALQDIAKKMKASFSKDSDDHNDAK